MAHERRVVESVNFFTFGIWMEWLACLGPALIGWEPTPLLLYQLYVTMLHGAEPYHGLEVRD